MPYIETSMDEFLEVANEGLLGAKKKSVDQLLSEAERRYKHKLKTVGDCDDQLVIINNEGRKFNECVRTMSKVKKQYDQGKLTKKQFNDQFRSATFLLKKNCRALQIQLGNVVDDTKAITAQELKDFSRFIAGLKKIVTQIRKALMGKPAKESYSSITAALEGEFDLKTLEEEESKSSSKDKDDDEDEDKDDDKKDKDKDKKKKDSSEDDFDGEPLEEKDDKKKKDKDDEDDDEDDDDEDKDDKKKKDDEDDDEDDDDDDKKDKKKKKCKDKEDDDDDEDDDEDKDDEEDDDDKKKKDDDDDDEKKKEDAKESAHVFTSAVIDEALEITSDWGIDYEDAFAIAKETVNVNDYSIDPAMEDYYYSSYDADRAVAGATAVAAGAALVSTAIERSFLAKIADYRDMPKGYAKDEYGFQLAEQLRKNPVLQMHLKSAEKWGDIPVEIRMYVRDQRSVPYSRNGVPMFSDYTSGRSKKGKRR